MQSSPGSIGSSVDPARPMTWPEVPGLLFGGDYNPEQWTPEIWLEDARLMRDAGINLVSVGVFSWSVLEPQEGMFDLDWLERVLDLMHQHRVAVDLATATASPPPWLTQEFPGVLPVDRFGQRKWPGGRQAYCPHSPDYRRHALRLVRRLAERFATHPALVMWHANNEYGCHTPACYCDQSAAAFREWLAARYGTLDAVNEAWGTAVWSMRYSDWIQIHPPRVTPDGTAPQPGLVLDFHRFSSDSLLDLFVLEKQAIREHDATHPVTTNFMSMPHITDMDYWAWSKHVDVVSTDHYTVAASAHRHIDLAFQADRTRGWARGSPWLLMEHAAGAVNWQPRNRTTEPGEILRDTVSYLAHGSDASLYFQFRAAIAGSERFHSALLPHAGPESERWSEVVELGRIMERLAEVRGSRVTTPIAMVWDFESAWALRQPNLPSVDLDYGRLTFEWYETMWEHGFSVDFVAPGTDVSGYALVLVPMAYIFRSEMAAALRTAAASGAQIVVSYFSGVADRHDRVIGGDAIGALTQLTGVRIEEFAPLVEGEDVLLSNGWLGSVWSEVSQSAGALAVASFPGERGMAVAHHHVGDGAVWYVGTRLHRWDLLLGQVAAAAQLAWEPADGLHVVERSKGGQSWVFAINHGTTTRTFTCAGFDLVTEQGGESVRIEPGAVAVIRRGDTS